MPTARLLTTAFHIQMLRFRDLCSFHMVGRYLQGIHMTLPVRLWGEVSGRQGVHLVMMGLLGVLPLAVLPLYSP